MKYTIEKLWNGSISPGETCGIHNPEIKEIRKLMERNKAGLERELSEYQKELFQKYDDCIEEYVYLISAEAFCEGFCIAGKLMNEAFV